MEELHHLSRDRVHARQIRAFVTITATAGEREVVERGFTAVLLGDDVIVMEGKFGKLSREVAILATMLRAFAHSLLEGCVHWVQAAAALSRKDRRALAFKNSKARPTFR